MQDQFIQNPQKSADCDQNVALPTLLRPVVLIGMMGSGKTTLGRLLATKLGVAFVDTDAVIVDSVGCSVADYFAQHGEEAFRIKEFETFQKIFENAPCVIGAGGGAIVYAPTRALIKKYSVPIFLQADVSVLAARCAGDHARPLLKKGNPQDILTDLLHQRAALYAEAAAFTVHTDTHTETEAIDLIIQGLKKCL